MDKIFIRGLMLEAKIGVRKWERKVKQRLIIDLEIGLDIQAAAASDQLEDSVSYKEIADCVAELVEKSKYKLIETVAEKIAATILEKYSVLWCKVTVNKPRAVEKSNNVGVCIERHAPKPD